MTEDEFRALVIQQFEALNGRMDALDGRMDALEGRMAALERTMTAGFAHADARMEGLYSRLNDHDDALDRLTDRVNGLRSDVRSLEVKVGQVADSTAQALDGVTALSRRLTKIEHPGNGGPATDTA